MAFSWIVHHMIRICPQSGVPLDPGAPFAGVEEAAPGEGTARLTVPRNGYAPFQVVLRAGTNGYKQTTVRVGAMLRSDGQRLPCDCEWFVQWYHRIQGKLMPDALVPWGEGGTKEDPLALVADRNGVPDQRYAGLWADLFVPKHALPGVYRGFVIIEREGEREERELELTVLDTAVPFEPQITADLNAYADSLSAQYGHLRNRPDRYTDGSFFRVERQYYRLAHDHRALLHNLPYDHAGTIPESFAPELEGNGRTLRVKDWSLFDEHFGPYLDGSAFAGSKQGQQPLPYMYLPFNFHWPADYVKFGTKGYRTEFQSVLDQFHEHFTRKGWLSTRFELFLNHKKRYKLFPYDGDETRFIWDEKINDLYGELAGDVLDRKYGARFIFRTDTSWCYGLHYNKYAHLFKLWVAHGRIFMWYPEALAHLQDAGAKVMTYGSAHPIHEPLVATVFGPISCIARGTDGFVYWNSVGCGERWEETPSGDGATALFYPGDRLFGIQGPIPSLRLKVLRWAMQAADCMRRYEQDNPDGGRAEMQGLIQEGLRVDSSLWWAPKPDFIDRPPYEWDNARLSEAAPVNFHRGSTAESVKRLEERLWAKLG